MKVECHRCKHKWDYRGEKANLLKKGFLKKKYEYPLYVSCPSCHTSVKIN